MDVTQLLQQARDGDSAARGELIQASYNELRLLAADRMRNERPDHTLTATALVHEVSLKLLEQSEVTASSRGQFLALASKAMRNLLVDHARSRGRQKRGGGLQKLSIDQDAVFADSKNQELIELDEALERFSQIEPRRGRVVELRYFGGLSIQETSGVLEISPATVKRDWEVAKAWLHRELRSEQSRVD